MKRILIPCVVIALLITACTALPKQYQTKDQIISVGPGPEDMVVDTISERPRIIISCNQRRDGQPYYGEINLYYPATGEVKIMKRHEPSDLHFYPHGLDLVRIKDSLILLVISNASKYNEQAILRYRVYKDSLVFINKITDPLIVSPNAVTGFSDGSILISNDMGKLGNYMEALFILKRAKIIYWKYNHCSVAADKFCYSNGITNRGGKVYLASTREDKVWSFDMKDSLMVNKQVVSKKLHGADNLRFDGDNLLVACHLRFLDFLKHMKDSTHLSPSTIYEVNPVTHEKKVVYYDSGAQISATATAVKYDGALYMSGVFDARIVKKKK
jgi:hypothetical protein